MPADEAPVVFLLLLQSLELKTQFIEDPKNAKWSSAVITRRFQDKYRVDSHQCVSDLSLSPLCWYLQLFSLKEARLLKLKIDLSVLSCFAMVVGLFLLIILKTFFVFFPVGYNRLRCVCSKRSC